MSSWGDVFADTIQEIGFEFDPQNAGGAHTRRYYRNFQHVPHLQWPQSEKFFTRVSVLLWDEYANIKWDKPGFYIDPFFKRSYPINRYAVEAMARIHQLIGLAEHKAKTGETLPVPERP